MRVVFRADAGLQIGSGHIARCLTLANALTKNGASCEFVCRLHDGHLCDWVQNLGFGVRRLPQVRNIGPETTSWLGADTSLDARQTIDSLGGTEVDWLIVDHYAIDHEWEAKLCTRAQNLLVIDDLANRHHQADVLIDQNLHDEPEKRYQSLVPEACRLWCGPRYALLRPDFAECRSATKRTSQETMNVFVFFGGMDETDITGRVLRTLVEGRDRLAPDSNALSLDVVVGASNPNQQELRQWCRKLDSMDGFSATLHVQVSEMAALMQRADLAIASGGSNTWERCCLGIPTLAIAAADNQMEASGQLDRLGVLRFIGRHDSLDDETLREEIFGFLRLGPDSSEYQAMRARAMALVDGGGVDRVVNAMLHSSARYAA